MDRIAARVVVLSTCLIFAIAAFLLARRVAGAFSSPLPAPQLLATAAIVAVWALSVRRWSSSTPAFVAIAIIVLFTLALACSYPGGRIVDWLVWPAAMFAVGLCPSIVHKSAERSKQLRVAPLSPKVGDAAESDAGMMLQQISRVRTADGCETVLGTLVAEFAPGERQTTLYVAFCPPFERLPQVEANVVDDSDSTVKLAQMLHNGAQLEVRLSEPAEEGTNVTIEFFATDAGSMTT
jgi:hypothetical protein